MVRCVPKPDRRAPNRLQTPTCKVCQSPDAVSVTLRGLHILCWRCATCKQFWFEAMPYSTLDSFHD